MWPAGGDLTPSQRLPRLGAASPSGLGTVDLQLASSLQTLGLNQTVRNPRFNDQMTQ